MKIPRHILDNINKELEFDCYIEYDQPLFYCEPEELNRVLQPLVNYCLGEKHEH